MRIIIPILLFLVAGFFIMKSRISNSRENKLEVEAFHKATEAGNSVTVNKVYRSPDSVGSLLASLVKRKGMNEEIVFLADMQRPSGQARFFVYSLKSGNVMSSGLVTHGRSDDENNPIFSNEEGSNCTSPGDYKIGAGYMGRFGLAYKLYGLSPTNSNAFKRFVVLHAHDCVPEDEVGYSICESQGCPTVSTAYLQELAAIINKSAKPILLRIY